MYFAQGMKNNLCNYEKKLMQKTIKVAQKVTERDGRSLDVMVRALMMAMARG